MWSCLGLGSAWIPAAGAFNVWNGAPTLTGVCYGLDMNGAPAFMALGNNFPGFTWGSPSAPDYYASGLNSSPIVLFTGPIIVVIPKIRAPAPTTKIPQTISHK
jgi:hypothetical protein